VYNNGFESIGERRCRRARQPFRPTASVARSAHGQGPVLVRALASTIAGHCLRVAPLLPESSNFTQTFRAARAGDQAALDALLPAVYNELKRIARSHLQRERPEHSLQATALVHEAYLRLLGVPLVDWSDRAWFMGLAATMMRRILVNHARDRLTEKRGAGAVHLQLDDAAQHPAAGFDLIGLHEALDALALLDPRQARVVELKYFAGMEIDEIAHALDISSATVRRDWTLARLWLARELKA